MVYLGELIETPFLTKEFRKTGILGIIRRDELFSDFERLAQVRSRTGRFWRRKRRGDLRLILRSYTRTCGKPLIGLRRTLQDNLGSAVLIEFFKVAHRNNAAFTTPAH